MHALREHARCQDFVLLGDSKLLSETNRRALLTAEVGYLAPLARTPELNTAFLAIPPEELARLSYVSERGRRLAAEGQTRYLGAQRTLELSIPDGSGGEQVHRPSRRTLKTGQA